MLKIIHLQPGVRVCVCSVTVTRYSVRVNVQVCARACSCARVSAHTQTHTHMQFAWLTHHQAHMRRHEAQDPQLQNAAHPVKVLRRSLSHAPSMLHTCPRCCCVYSLSLSPLHAFTQEEEAEQESK